MRDIKPKIINRYECASPVKKDEVIKRYPSITLDLNTLPEAKDWEVGSTYTVKLKLKMTGLSMRKSSNKGGYDDEWGNNSTYDIHGIEVDGDESDDEDDE